MDEWERYAKDKIRRERMGELKVAPFVLPPGGSGSGNPAQFTNPEPPPPPPGPTPDGHKYDIQKAANETGLIWMTVDSANNLADAIKQFDQLVNTGGFFQLLQDGKLVKTNLAIDQRYDAVQKKKAEEYLKDVWSVEALMGKQWTWIADAGSLEEAKNKLKAIRAGGASASIPGSSSMRITDKKGAIVFTDIGVAPRPGAEAQSYTDEFGVNWYKLPSGLWSRTPPGTTAEAQSYTDEFGVNWYKLPSGLWSRTPPGTTTGCFIATASMSNTPFEKDIDALRNFRDESLPVPMVKLYYKHSPKIANRIRGSDILRGMTRAILKPLVAVTKKRYGTYRKDGSN